MSSCCTPDGSCSSGATDVTVTVADGKETVYNVTGMTCGHCETAVTKAIGELDGVLSVAVDVSAGRVTVTAGGDLDDTLIAKAVDDAGYQLAGRA